MTTEDIYMLAQTMEADGVAHKLTLAMTLNSISPYFGIDLTGAVNRHDMTWDEVILALYLFVIAAPDLV